MPKYELNGFVLEPTSFKKNAILTFHGNTTFSSSLLDLTQEIFRYIGSYTRIYDQRFGEASGTSCVYDVFLKQYKRNPKKSCKWENKNIQVFDHVNLAREAMRNRCSITGF